MCSNNTDQITDMQHTAVKTQVMQLYARYLHAEQRSSHSFAVSARIKMWILYIPTDQVSTGLAEFCHV